MGKTTNILDLNNRLTKVEKENVAQNNYNSLQNRPKINSNLLTGNKTSAQLGLADAKDLALHSISADYDFAALTAEEKITWFTNWTDNINFPVLYGSGVLIPCEDPSQKAIIYIAIGGGTGAIYTNVYANGAWGTWKQLQFVS